MVTPTGEAPHIPFHLGPTQASMDTPTPTNGMAASGGAGGYVQPPPGIGVGLGPPPGLPQPASNMSAAQQLKDRLMKGKWLLVFVRPSCFPNLGLCCHVQIAVLVYGEQPQLCECMQSAIDAYTIMLAAVLAFTATHRGCTVAYAIQLCTDSCYQPNYAH